MLSLDFESCVKGEGWLAGVYKVIQAMRLAWMLFVISLFAAPVLSADQTSSGIEFFETKIRPALAEYCLSCHTGELAQPKLAFDLISAVAGRRVGSWGALSCQATQTRVH